MNKPQQALPLLEKALSSFPLGLAYQRLGKDPQAERAYREALRENLS